MSSSSKHPRTELNNACQALFGNDTSRRPRYSYQSHGPQNNITWTAFVHIDNIEYGRGEGRNQDIASDAAATKALHQLRNQYNLQA